MHLVLLLILFSSFPVGAAQSTGTFQPTGDMTTSRTGHTATLLLNGKVLITGGWPAPTTAELFDPDTGTFSLTGDMMTGGQFHTATLLADGRVLIAGGYDSFGIYQRSAEIYDPASGTFTRTGNMVGPQVLGDASLLNNGKVYISGPCTDGISNADPFCCRPQLYNPAAGTFSAGESSWPTCGAALLPNGKVLIASPPKVYDPATDALSPAGPRITTGFYGITETLLTNGKVLIAGGIGDYGLSANGELYDPLTEKFTAVENMIHLRAEHTATLLRDGTVLVAGGSTLSTRLQDALAVTAELYDPATGTFTSTADMTSPRKYHTATLLTDGRILIAGGYSGYGGTASAELYIPPELIPASLVTELRFDRTSAAAGSFYSVGLSGSHLTPEMFFDVRFTRPGSNESAVVLNWQKGVAASHDVPAGSTSGVWTINGVRAHSIESDHTGSFFPVSATITVP